MNFERYMPRIVVVEAIEPRTKNLQTCDEWEWILEKHGYSLVLEFGLNRYYVAKQYWGRYAKAFDEAKEIEDLYYIFRIKPTFWK